MPPSSDRLRACWRKKLISCVMPFFAGGLSITSVPTDAHPAVGPRSYALAKSGGDALSLQAKFVTRLLEPSRLKAFFLPHFDRSP